MIKIFIIDDHQMIIEGIKTLLQDQTDISWLGSAKSPEDLMAFLKHDQPDVLLMDIYIPSMSGLDPCREVKEKYPSVQIIGLSTSDQPSIIRKMLENGASGYLLKDANKNEIITAIQEVAKGKRNMNFSVSEILKKKMPNDQLPALTRREKEILELISEGHTNQEIANKLFLHITTIDSHRKNMLTKFNAKNTAALIKIAMINNLL